MKKFIPLSILLATLGATNAQADGQDTPPQATTNAPSWVTSWDVTVPCPVYVSENQADNIFFEGGFDYQDARKTVDGALGYRHLMSDNKVMLGANVLYSHEFPRNHQRISYGAEIRTSVFEINSNYYHRLTDWKLTGVDNNEEKARGGYDVELALAVPYVPSAHFRVKHFCWNGIASNDSNNPIDDLKGNTFSVSGSVYDGLSVEVGYIDYTSGNADYSKAGGERFLKVSYNFDIFGTHVNKATKPRFSNTPYEFERMDDRRFEKIRFEQKVISAHNNEQPPA
ncbi:inverse autotransporter beta domain-containing protein [Pelodictyon luteolum]|nr:inverse autotransporter beta-barrel domain-containing protein [Pelodictyon luteolum]